MFLIDLLDGLDGTGIGLDHINLQSFDRIADKSSEKGSKQDGLETVLDSFLLNKSFESLKEEIMWALGDEIAAQIDP